MARISRRQSLGGGVAVLGGLLAAACGEPTVRYVGQPQAGPAGPAGPQGAKGAAGAQGAKGAQGAAGAAAKQPVTVTLWGTWYGWRGEADTGERIIGMKQLFEQWNQTGSHVYAEIGGKGTPDKIITAYAANQQPDFYDPAYWDSGLFGQAGMLVDMNDFIRSDKQYADSLADYFPFLLETSSLARQVLEPPLVHQCRPALHQPGALEGVRAATAEAGIHLGRPGGVPQEAPDDAR